MNKIAIKFYKVVQLYEPWLVGKIYMLLLQISCSVSLPKNYENWLAVDKVIAIMKGYGFSDHRVEVYL